MSLTLAAVVMTCSRVPRPSQIRWRLLPAFRRSTGDGLRGRLPLFHTNVGAVHARAGPVEFADRVQLGEQHPVELVEDSGLLPAIQPPPAGLSGAEPQLRWQELPGHIVEQDVQNALQTESVRKRLGPGDRSGQGGSSGSISAHKSPSTIHGRVLTPSPTAGSSHRSRSTRTLLQDRVTSSKHQRAAHSI